MTQERQSSEIMVDQKNRAVVHAGNLHIAIPFMTLCAMAAFIWAARGWKEELASRADLQTLSATVDTALGVLKDHGTEFIEVRREMSAASSRMATFESVFRDELKQRTEDRYTATDAERELGSLRREIDAERRSVERRLESLEGNKL